MEQSQHQTNSLRWGVLGCLYSLEASRTEAQAAAQSVDTALKIFCLQEGKMDVRSHYATY